MHPPLALHLHPLCKEVIIEFENCHKEHPYKKFIGACNDLKTKLDKCLTEEYQHKRKENKLKRDAWLESFRAQRDNESKEEGGS